MPVSSSNISFCRGGVAASPICLCGCVSISIEMYMVYRLQVTVSHTTFPPASTAAEIVTWWEGRNFLDRGLQGGDGPTQCWGSGSCAAPEQTKATSRCKGFVPPPNASDKWQSPAMVGLTEPRDLWLFALKSIQARVLPPSPHHSIQAIVLHSSSWCSTPWPPGFSRKHFHATLVPGRMVLVPNSGILKGTSHFNYLLSGWGNSQLAAENIFVMPHPSPGPCSFLPKCCLNLLKAIRVEVLAAVQTLHTAGHSAKQSCPTLTSRCKTRDALLEPREDLSCSHSWTPALTLTGSQWPLSQARLSNRFKMYKKW